MEDNSLTPSPMPTPDPGTSMPEFAAAPVQPAQPLPPASAMPDFGSQQPVAPAPLPPVDPTQPMPMPAAQPMSMPMPGAAPTAAPTAMLAQPAMPVESAQPVAQAPEMPEATTASELGEIMDAGVDPTQAATPAMPTVAPVETPADPAMNPTSPADAATPTDAATQAAQPTPAPATPEKKKPNTKLIILIGVAALLVVGCIVAAILLLNQPKNQSNPTDAPAQPAATVEIDTSTDFSKLTSEEALAFLEATAGDTTYFPENYADAEALDLIADKNIAMYYSYEKKADIIDIVKEADFNLKFKDKITEETATITEKSGYAVVELSEDSGCEQNCTGLIFDKKTVNYYSEPYTDVLTGIQSQIVHIMLEDHSKATVEKVAPLIASVFMWGQKIYSTELKEENGEFEFIVNTLEYSSSKKDKATAKQTHFKVISTGEFLYMPDLTTETVL